ncbi:MAG TPA: transposase [Alloacidobacterium sp.]|jgi:transposase|nr:transposase [Alloacidobacterium sp.]
MERLRRHTSRDFVAFLEEVASLCPLRQRIHIIFDNLLRPQNAISSRFPATAFARAVSLHPDHSPWLNQVELWFAKIEREVIARSIFTSVTDLARLLRRYVSAYSADAPPIRWKYSNPSRRSSNNEFTAIVH